MGNSKPIIPAHLKQYVVDQHYEKYTPIDHAVWRYVMRQNHHFLKDKAHHAYLDGLTHSGICIESIPRVEDMNDCLNPFRWGAVTIDGYIPGVAFFDFQARGMLPIAAEIRRRDHIEYTPAPDIIHEAAGHAPILCDEKYAEYVKIFGEIGCKALASKEEHDVFAAIRKLSDILENGIASEQEIQAARADLEYKQTLVKGVSEAEQISRLYWWTVEYGLIGDLHHPKIYGAGLLSSVGESAHSLSNHVKKIPFDLETVIETPFDITTMQPQLFVCEDFDQLISAVRKYSERMAFRVGGTESLLKALQSNHPVYVTFSSGLQVTGTMSRIITNQKGEAIYFITRGPTALSVDHQELLDHSTKNHPNGIGAVIGNLKGLKKNLEDLTEEELIRLKLVGNHTCSLLFESGITVNGTVKDICRQKGKLIYIEFQQAEVKVDKEILFEPGWGTYLLTIGNTITSVAAGAADPESFYPDPPLKGKQELKKRELNLLERLFGEVRIIREKSNATKEKNRLLEIIGTLQTDYPEEWLLRVEILELIAGKEGWEETTERLRKQLDQLKNDQPSIEKLITNGMKLIEE